MLEAVISFPPTEHLNKRILNSDGNVSIQMSGKTNNSENKPIQKRKHKNLLIFFQQNYCVPALWNMLYIHHLYIGCIVNWVTCYFWKKILACITVLLWTDLGGLFALLFMFLLLFFSRWKCGFNDVNSYWLIMARLDWAYSILVGGLASLQFKNHDLLFHHKCSSWPSSTSVFLCNYAWIHFMPCRN